MYVSVFIYVDISECLFVCVYTCKKLHRWMNKRLKWISNMYLQVSIFQMKKCILCQASVPDIPVFVWLNYQSNWISPF